MCPELGVRWDTPLHCSCRGTAIYCHLLLLFWLLFRLLATVTERRGRGREGERGEDDGSKGDEEAHSEGDEEAHSEGDEPMLWTLIQQ